MHLSLGEKGEWGKRRKKQRREGQRDGCVQIWMKRFVPAMRDNWLIKIFFSFFSLLFFFSPGGARGGPRRPIGEPHPHKRIRIIRRDKYWRKTKRKRNGSRMQAAERKMRSIIYHYLRGRILLVFWVSRVGKSMARLKKEEKASDIMMRKRPIVGHKERVKNFKSKNTNR
jgi:hypothetical protein